MEYKQTVTLKNGQTACIRNGEFSDGKDALDVFNVTHAETDYLLSYPEESSFTVEQESSFLQAKTESKNEIELIIEVDGKIVGMAGFEPVGSQIKLRHRAEFGVSILKEYWGLGIGSLLIKACIECAKEAGYQQLELNYVSENERAGTLYKKYGFVEFGRNPYGFRLRSGEYRELVYMRLEL